MFIDAGLSRLHRSGRASSSQFCCVLLPDPRVSSQKQHRSIKDCAKHCEECEGLRFALFQCKRGQLDARTRIPGNKGY